MSVIGSILNPLQPQPNPPSGGSGGTSEPENPNTVTPTEGSESTGGSGSGTSTSAGSGGSGGASSGSGTSGGGSSASSGSNGGISESREAGQQSRAAGAASDAGREARAVEESDAAIRFRAENAGKAFQTERSVVERLFEINPDTKVSDIISRIESSESDEAKINSQRFVERLGEIRRAETPVEVESSGPVFLDTNDSSEPVGRYDKSA